LKDNHKTNEKPKETVTIPKEEYEALLARHEEKDALHDKYLRAHAEFENMRKRLERERVDVLRYAKEEFVSEFMPILDSMEMAAKHIDSSNDAKALKDGLSMIDAQVKKFLKDLGVEKIKTVGEKFDPHIHEAVEAVEADDKDENLIVEELKAGYTLNGKLIRPAAVKIVKHSENI